MTAFANIHDLVQAMRIAGRRKRDAPRIVLAAGTVRIPLRFVGYDSARDEVVLEFEKERPDHHDER